MTDIAGLVRNSPAVAFSREYDTDPSLPPAAQSTEQLVDILLNKMHDVEVRLEGKADRERIKSEIALGSELVKIQATEVAVVGNFTVVDIENERRGDTSGQVAARLTRVIGDLVQTGAMVSNNWGVGQGMAIDLDNETIHAGGSASPKLHFDGTNLFIAGTIQSGSNIAGTTTVDGGSSLSHILGDAQAGYDIQQKLEVSGNTILAGTIQPQNAGGVKVGTISWNSSTGELTGGSGVALTEYGIISAASGAATFTLQASTGSATYAGNVNTAGQLKGTGVDLDGANASIVAKPVTGSVIGIAVIKDALATTYGIDSVASGSSGNQVAIRGSHQASGGVGVLGNATVSGASGLEANNTAGGDALTMTSPKISGDANFLDDVDIDGTFNVDGASTMAGITMDGDLTLNGNSDIRVDRSMFAATDNAGGDSSIVLGASSGNTGTNTLVFNEGAAGSLVAGQMHIYGQLDSGQSKTCLAWVSEALVETGTGAFAGIKQYPVYINGVRYVMGIK